LLCLGFVELRLILSTDELLTLIKALRNESCNSHQAHVLLNYVLSKLTLKNLLKLGAQVVSVEKVCEYASSSIVVKKYILKLVLKDEVFDKPIECIESDGRIVLNDVNETITVINRDDVFEILYKNDLMGYVKIFKDVNDFVNTLRDLEQLMEINSRNCDNVVKELLKHVDIA